MQKLQPFEEPKASQPNTPPQSNLLVCKLLSQKHHIINVIIVIANNPNQLLCFSSHPPFSPLSPTLLNPSQTPSLSAP
jgi:hypothetical protein